MWSRAATLRAPVLRAAVLRAAVLQAIALQATTLKRARTTETTPLTMPFSERGHGLDCG